MTAIVILSSIAMSGVQSVYAATDTSETVRAFEAQNVMDDLDGASVDGEEIDLTKYNFDERKNTQILSFVEYCYSFYSNNQQDYGLYVYVYNPRGLDFTQKPALNQIEFRAGGDSSASYGKYNLEYLNRSETPGFEGLFYKFKVALTDTERTEILKSLNSTARIYEVSGIELYSSGTNATEYTVANTYTYSGYAEGYGSASASENTLNCTVDGYDEYLTSDVHSTYWMPDGTHSDGYTKDVLHSVYFAVPNETIEEYGEMTAVHATWLNARTAPILVTGNKDIYNAAYLYLGEYVAGGTRRDRNPNTNLNYAMIATKAAEEARTDVEMAPYAGYYAYNNYLGIKLDEFSDCYDNQIFYLNYLFYAENGNADNYILPAEKIVGDKTKGVKGWLETFTEQFGFITQSTNNEGDLITGADPGRNSVNDKYSTVLFSEVDEDFTEGNISADKEYNLTDLTISDNIWDRLFGTTNKGGEPYTMSAIQSITVKDINFYPDSKVFCDKFYISESDYDEFIEFTKQSESQNKTVYLFRYYQSEYVSNEVTEYKRSSTFDISTGSEIGTYSYVDTNAYFCQMWVQLDFDIIDLTFTKDNVKTVIPVIMSPMDLAADAVYPVSTIQQDENGGGLPLWAWILIAVAITVIVIIIIKCSPALCSGMIDIIKAAGKVTYNVITFPFRWIQRRRDGEVARMQKQSLKLQKAEMKERLKEQKQDLRDRRSSRKQSEASRKLEVQAIKEDLKGRKTERKQTKARNKATRKTERLAIKERKEAEKQTKTRKRKKQSKANRRKPKRKAKEQKSNAGSGKSKKE